jgi:hypothetical protein
MRFNEIDFRGELDTENHRSIATRASSGKLGDCAYRNDENSQFSYAGEARKGAVGMISGPIGLRFLLTCDSDPRRKIPKNRFDETAPLVNLTTRQTRDSSNQELVLVHLGLQIGLNFVPARKAETAFAETTARQAVIFAGPRD